jgi:hypothetical protein
MHSSGRLIVARPRRRPKPTPSGRYRRYRQRVRTHRTVPAMPDIGEIEISFLVEAEWLDDAVSGDRRMIGDAIARFLSDTAKRWQTRPRHT